MKRRKVQSLDEVDVELEEALSRIRDRVERMEHGRVIAIIERQERVTIGHVVHVDGMLTEEIERVMTEKPRKEVQRCRWPIPSRKRPHRGPGALRGGSTTRGK